MVAREPEERVVGTRHGGDVVNALGRSDSTERSANDAERMLAAVPGRVLLPVVSVASRAARVARRSPSARRRLQPLRPATGDGTHGRA